MMRKNSFSIFVSTLLIVGFFILAMPEKGFTGCCQTIESTGAMNCQNTIAAACTTTQNIGYTLIYYPVEVCSSNSPGFPSYCESSLGAPSPSPVSSFPTLSEWGLISLASLLAIVGLIDMRRRELTV